MGYPGPTQRMIVSDMPASYRDGSFMAPGPGYGAIMPRLKTVYQWSPDERPRGMGDIEPFLQPPRTVYNWYPGMGEMTAQEVATSITASIAGAAGSIFASDAARKAAKSQAKYGARAEEARARADMASSQNYAKALQIGVIAAAAIAGIAVLGTVLRRKK